MLRVHRDTAVVCVAAATNRKNLTIINERGELTGRSIELPANDTHITIIKLEKCARPLNAFPQNVRRADERACALTDFNHAIYIDGGTTWDVSGGQTQRSGASSAGLIYINRATMQTEQHARYYTRSTNNVCEWAALVGALHFIKDKKINERVVIVNDSELVYHSFVKADPPKTIKLQDLYRQAKALHTANVELVHMMRNQNNPADAVVKEARDAMRGLGDENLFPDAPFEPTPAAASTGARAAIVAVNFSEIGETIAASTDKIKSVDDFFLIRRLHSRSRCPRGTEQMWAQIVKSQTTAIITAPTRDARSKALVGFMLLPTLFMPTRSSTTRLMTHLSTGRAFTIDIDAMRAHATTASSQQDHDQMQRQRDRRPDVARSVERLAHDYQIRNAVKLMQANAESERLPFDKIVEKLAAKFPPRLPENALNASAPTYVPEFTRDQVALVIRRMSKNAATAIDGWTQRLLESAIRADASIADDLGVFLSWIAFSHGRGGEDDAQMHFDKFSMDLVRAARLVGIPKDGGGVRPIVISSSIAKLTGALVLRRANVKPLKYQYAIARPDGAKTIIHETRRDYDNGAAIIRIDSSNAYNITKRSQIARMLVEEKQTSDVIAYFNTMYQPAADLIIYGPGGTSHKIRSDEGVRQGDALSSYYFCLVLHRVCVKLAERYPDANIKCFMDDMTITVPPAMAIEVMQAAVELLEAHGFVVNVDKSAVVCKQRIAMPADAQVPFAIESADRPFKMLGANITDNYEQMHEELIRRIGNFFDSLDVIDVHPEIKHTILHLCGKPKLIYFCETTPPQHSRHITQFFDARAKQSYATLIGVADTTNIDDVALHSVDGADIPDYTANADQLYTNARTNALTNMRSGAYSLTERLAEPHSNATFPEASYDRYWSHYLHAVHHEQLPPALYITALALRTKTIPDRIRPRSSVTRCSCGDICNGIPEIIQHALLCDSMSRITPAMRHTYVKDALRFVAARYGIRSTNEPGIYVYANTAVRHRPDITFHLYGSNIATDITIVRAGATPGANARYAAEKKIQHHSIAVNNQGHEFVPFAMEVNGHIDQDCFKLIKKIAEQVPRYERHWFIKDMIGAASTALAKYRALAVRNAAADDLSFP